MDDQQGNAGSGAKEYKSEALPDMIEEPVHVALDPEEFEERVHLELHKSGIKHDRDAHIDLSEEKYQARRDRPLAWHEP